MYSIYWFQGKSLLEYTKLFSPNEYKNNDKIILKHFQCNLNKVKCIGMFATNIENYQIIENTKISYIFKKSLSLPIIYSKCDHEYEKIFKEEESIEIIKIIGLIINIE